MAENTNIEDLNTDGTAQVNPEAVADGKGTGEVKADVKPDTKSDGEAKGGDAAKGDDVIPETYDLKLAEKSGVPNTMLERLKTDAKEMGLTNAEAQEYLNTHERVISDFQADQLARLDIERGEWVKAVKADKEIGWEAFDENIAISRRLLKETASKDFYDKVLAPKADGGMGMGDHPEMVRMMVRLAKRGFAEDKAVHGGVASDGKKSDVEVMYPNKQ